MTDHTLTHKRLYDARDDVEGAELAGVLTAAGISVRSYPAGARSALGDLPADVLRVELWVETGRLEEAAKLIRRHQERTRIERERVDVPWRCPACSEDNEGSFDICWSCERPREQTG